VERFFSWLHCFGRLRIRMVRAAPCRTHSSSWVRS
jgi:hypothetical protein